MCFWSEGNHGGDSCRLEMCSPVVPLPAAWSPAPLAGSDGRAGSSPAVHPEGCSVLLAVSPPRAPRLGGVSANSLPPCSCLTIRHFTFGSGWAVPAGETCCPSPRWPGAVTSRAGRALSPVEPSPRAVAASPRHSCRAVLWTVYLSPTSFPPSSVCAQGVRHKSTKCM